MRIAASTYTALIGSSSRATTVGTNPAIYVPMLGMNCDTRPTKTPSANAEGISMIMKTIVWNVAEMAAKIARE